MVSAAWAILRDPRFIGGFVLGGFLLGVGGYLASDQLTAVKYRGGLLHESSAPYKYIDPLLACDIGSESAFPELKSIKDALAGQIAQDISNGAAQNISVYFRGLNSARWFEINGNTPFVPASLLKTFVMMAYYKAADDTDNPGLLQEQVPFEGAGVANDNPGEIIPHLTNGAPYTVEQLIEQMIIYSDNNALYTLVDHFDSTTLSDFELLFKDLNIPSPVTQNENSLASMTANQYSLIFQVLYSSSYLSERYSEKALDLLTQAQYKDGIVAGVPSSVTVAHKFGVTTITSSTSTPAVNELHDCGIVYYPGHPYLLCIMTAGNNFGQLQNDIRELSATAYQQFDKFVQAQQ